MDEVMVSVKFSGEDVPVEVVVVKKSVVVRYDTGKEEVYLSQDLASQLRSKGVRR